LHRTVNAQELERKRIARELHDETGQTLTALGLGLHGLAETIPKNPQKAIQQAGQLQSLATNGLANLQGLVSGLHPPQLDELGFVAAVRGYTEELSRLSNEQIVISGSVNESTMPEAVRLTMFRITQEAINNAVRHADASQIKVLISDDDSEIRLVVMDDGQGFEVENTLQGEAKKCLGLLGMIERTSLIGGTCQIKSGPGMGTVVEVRIKRGTE